MLQTVAIRTPKHLCIKDNSLIIREKGSSVVIGKIALSDIWVIIIDNPQVTMTSALISGINDVGIGVLYCGSDHMPNGLALPLGAHSRHAEIVEHQLAISKPLRNQIWKRLLDAHKKKTACSRPRFGGAAHLFELNEDRTQPIVLTRLWGRKTVHK